MDAGERTASLASAVQRLALRVAEEQNSARRRALVLAIHKANFLDARMSSGPVLAAEWAGRMDGFIRTMVTAIDEGRRTHETR